MNPCKKIAFCTEYKPLSGTPIRMKWMTLLPVFGLICACQPVGITDQATLSRPIFDFDGSGTRSFDCGLTNQLETGRASSSNVAAGGCASCR